MNLKLSVLDLGTLPLSLELAPRVEALGYERYWISEHHGEGLIINPTLAVPLVAGITERMRIGTGGVLLRFQSALAVAQNFRMLQLVFPGRIDLGLARAPTSAEALTTALLDGRGGRYTADDHKRKVEEVQRLLAGRLEPGHPLIDASIEPVITRVGPPPLWTLSTSIEGARTAAALGTHYSFHDYYAPTVGPEAVERYVREFQPSAELDHPVWNVCVRGWCAETEAEAAIVRETAFKEDKAGTRIIVGTEAYWVEQLSTILPAYRAGELMIQTLGGDYELEEQVASFARIKTLVEKL